MECTRWIRARGTQHRSSCSTGSPLGRTYTDQRHCDRVQAFPEALDLRDATLSCQDRGSLIGPRLAAELEDRLARVVV